jgi:hypothetical protein
MEMIGGIPKTKAKAGRQAAALWRGKRRGAYYCWVKRLKHYDYR